MTTNNMKPTVMWLAASYHFPITYSCRSPISSPHAGTALPTPGPATVQLAMIRTAIELYGHAYTRDRLFTDILACMPLIRPPDAVAISEQVMKLYKADDSGNYVDGIGYRQTAHAEDNMIIYVKARPDSVDNLSSLMTGIGYWGQTDSFTHCIDIAHQAPQEGSYACPLEEFNDRRSLGRHFTAYVTELKAQSVTWNRIVDVSSRDADAVQLRLYVWPLVYCEHRSSGQLLRYCSLV